MSQRSRSGSQSTEHASGQEEMQDQTPLVSPTEATQTDSRYNMLRDTPPPQRKELVWLTYSGRKSVTGRVARAGGEHIDVIVPDEDNEGLVAAYLEQVTPGGIVGEPALKQLADAGLSHENIQLSGQHYHFAQGERTPVHPDHVGWLMDHKRYAFTQTDESGQAAPGAGQASAQDGSAARQSKTTDKTQE